MARSSPAVHPLRPSGANRSWGVEGLEQFEWFIEATGSQAVLSTLLQQAPTGAALLLLGLPYEDQTFNFDSIVAYDRAVIGSVGSSGADFEEALATMPQIDTDPFLKESHPLEEFKKALKLARSKDFVKVMLKTDATRYE